MADWRQAIIWTNAGILLIGPLGTNFSEILIKILTFSFKKLNHVIQENAFESVICETAAILSRPQWVNRGLQGLSLTIWVLCLQINGSGQDCGDSIADALELPEYCTKPSIWYP